MKTYRIFLASSFELRHERIEFGNFMLQENKRYNKENVNFELEVWEDLDDAVSVTRKQNDYNESLEKCDIFVAMFWTKMGKYTLEEYSHAKKLFDERKSPRIYVYQKISQPTKNVSEFDKKSKENFLSLFNETDKEHFPWQFENTAELINRFKKSLDDLFTNNIFKYGEPAKTLSPDLPGEPTFFIGRDEELKEIRQRLGQGSNFMLINAEGGMGKTSLAAKYWFDTLYDYKYNAWLFCESGIVSELKRLAPALKIDLTQFKTEEEQIAALKGALQNIANDFLLVLDNANNPEDIKVFKDTFRGFQWHVLITSRANGVFEKNQEYSIEHLQPENAKKLFINFYKEDSKEFNELLDRLLNAIGYNTLLIELFAKNMNELKMRGETLADLLKRLEEKGLFLEKRSFEVVTEYTGNVRKKAATTDDILNTLYDFSKLDEEERYRLVNTAILPATNYNFIFLCDLFEQDRYKFKTLHTLAGKGWLIKTEDGFRTSPVIQQLVLTNNKNSLKDDCMELINHLNEKLENDSIYIKDFNNAPPFVELILFITKHLIYTPFY